MKQLQQMAESGNYAQCIFFLEFHDKSNQQQQTLTRYNKQYAVGEMQISYLEIEVRDRDMSERSDAGK